MPRARPARLFPPQRVALVAVLLASVLVARPAHAFRLHGVAVSDSGPFVTVVMRVHLVGAEGLAGRMRCIGQCLARRYKVQLVATPDGSFTGTLTNPRTQCAIAGALVAGPEPGLQGRYSCLRTDGAADSGSFLVTR